MVGAHLKEIELEVKKFLFLSDLIVCSFFHFFASVEVVARAVGKLHILVPKPNFDTGV